jgi:DNA-binding response OmpR family regulator
MVLGIGYCESEYGTVRKEWKSHGVYFRFVNSVEEAVRRFLKEPYVCITICVDRVGNGPLDYLRRFNAPPIILIPSGCNIAQRASLLQRGASDYLKNATNQWQAAESSGKDAIQFYLDSAIKATDPLTIITDGVLYFCLETRTVEVLGRKIDLTPKEFEILALMIPHAQRVYTFEVLTYLIWGEEYQFDIHKKTIINHMSSLRRKLQVTPDVRNYIVSVSKAGYKFDIIV